MKEMKTEIQETELYKKFKKALNITMDMRADDNPFVVECCKIANEYASQFRQEWIPVEERLPEETTTNFITAKKLSGRMVFIDHKYEVWYSRGANTWYCGVHLFKDYFPDLTIVAWQPVIIPQPYNHTKS